MIVAITTSIEFARPAVLLLLPLVVAWLTFCTIRSLVDLPRAQRFASLAVRLLMATLLVLALSGVVLISPTQQKFIVVAVDQSESVGEEAQEFISDWLNKAQDAVGDRVVFLPFAENPGRVRQRAKDATAHDGGGETEESPASLATNLEAAVEAAASSIPPFHVPEVVLITDGHQTHGDVLRVASTIGVPITTVPLPDREADEVQVTEIVAPSIVRAGEPFYLEVIIDSSSEQKARIDVFRDQLRVDLGQTTHALIAGENRFRFRQQATDRRQMLYTVRVEAERDTLLDNNHSSALVTASGKPRVLLVDDDLATADPLRWALEEQSILVDPRPINGMPSALAEMQGYDAIILSNVPATGLSLNQLQTLRTYVQTLGGGLVVLGGDQAFGLGGYYKTTLEEILPVRSDFKQEKEKPSLAMVLIIDRSGSMGGIKLELAKDAARSAVELLGPRDQIGVVAFDIETHWVSELHSAADKEFITKRIDALAPGGGTNMYPALVQAHRSLQTAIAKLKHVIILTDGISSPGDFTGITANLVSDRITVSTVAIGDGADLKLLQAIAEQGNGRHYVCADPQSIPQVFAKETVTASRSAIREVPLVPRRIRSSEILGDLDLENAPPLFGYVATRPKRTSEVVLATDQGEPLLAWWRYGLGKTLAFTSDAKNRWAAEWLTWHQFPRFWGQMVRHVMRQGNAIPGELIVEHFGDSARVTFDVVDRNGQFRNQLATELLVITPTDGSSSNRLQKPMRQTAPGRYEAEFRAVQPGPYLLDVRQTDGTEMTLQRSHGLFVGYPSELRIRPTDTVFLRQISRLSGGRFDPRPEQLLDDVRTVPRAQSLWRLLLMLALVLLLPDIALRRFAVARPIRKKVLHPHGHNQNAAATRERAELE